MSSDPPELGKGLFGYRKSAVNQILSDRDIMLRQAEGRVRAAESKVAELEAELHSMRDRNSRMDEQLDRLRAQLDVVVGATFGHEGHTAPPPVAERPAEPAMPLASEVTTPQPEAAEGHGFEEPHEAAPHQEPATAWEPQGGWTQPAPEETSSSDADSPYGQFKDYTEHHESEASFTGLDRPEHDEDAGGMPLVFEDTGDDDVLDSAGLFDEADDRAEPHLTFEPHRDADSPHTAWEDVPPAPEPT